MRFSRVRSRALLATGPVLLLGCSALLDLDSLKKAECVADDCGGTAQGASSSVAGASAKGGSGSHAGTSSGSSSGGGLPGAGSANGGSAPIAEGGDSAANGGSSSGGGASGGPAGGGGTGGTTGTAGGGGSGGAGGQPTGGCQPTAVDQVCDGLDQACKITAQDAGCIATCKGSFVQGSSYMSCLAASDFDQAEAACVANGMHLAKIDSAAENATVLSLAADDYVWIGGSNRADESAFAWMDGAIFYSSGAAVGGSYENFAAGEPMADADLRCVQLMQPDDGTWSNWHCTETQSFVCERY